jgi:mannose-6-phosphate isomerase
MDPLPEGVAAELASRPRLLRLQPSVQRYAWGGYDFIPGLLGETNAGRAPHAELWLGAHPVAPATTLVGGRRVSLATLFERAAPALMGERMAARFGTLPYLLKVLDVRSTLSIQAHPDRAQAREGFALEEALDIPRSSPIRNYRDASHKPEVSLALTDFWMLLGFRSPREIAAATRRVPELGRLFEAAAVPAPPDGAGSDEDWLRGAYGRVMRLPQAEIDAALCPLEGRLERTEAEGALEPVGAEFWALRALREFRPPNGLVDRGVASVFLLNLLRLGPGDAVFIPAGLLHAYLEGAAVEIMAASDNVLRGGLTPKHVDVEELLRVLRFDPEPPRLLAADRVGPTELAFHTPTIEFRLDRLDIGAGQRTLPAEVRGVDVLLVLEGSVVADTGIERTELGRGAAALAPNGLAYSLFAPDRALVVRASIPQ